MPDDPHGPRVTAAPQPMNGLLLLLNLQQEARQAQDEKALRFLMVNQTRRLIHYQQAFFMAIGANGKARLEAAANIAAPERDAPLSRWLDAAATAIAAGPEKNRPHPVTVQELPPALGADWGQWGAGHALWLPLHGPDGIVTAALWLTREKPWTEGEQTLLVQLAGAYGHAWWALTRTRRRSGRWALNSRRVIITAAVILLILAIPVRQSTLAPGEVAPRDPMIVAAPLEGVIRRFHVQPNDPVTEGQALFSFEDMVLKSRLEVARKSLTSAEAEWLTASQGAFGDPQSKARVAQLKAQVDLRKAELDYAAELMDRVTVKADRAGIAVYTNPNDWLGRPVTIGERIMTLADAAEAEIDVQVPVSDAMILENGAAVSLFLNVDPLRPVRGRIVHASYEPGMTPAGILAYRVRAELEPGQDTPRIGLRGTAKIQGDRVPLAFYLFRRPLATLRQAVGL
ncbi:efflux RND transporter periplasmic adaptor subunit [Niveispirillum fermenti]|uniref:efflux RND transporter periplasmic adaptor subunit n=1 Tax=Niveispirillum fermenti TaxID=1233113 RepID=UPI003A8A1967